MITPNLIAWQWESYRIAHRDRRNLLIHALTNPLFVFGLAVAIGGVVTAHWVWLGGLVAPIVAMGAQGKGHGLEVEPPAPFRSPLDVLARIFTEQLVTFPRFVLTGRFAEAWRAARTAEAQ